jgi:membrane protease YdiL (CAAX protease family)
LLAVLIVWLPYIVSTGLQERLGLDGPFGPALMLFALLMCWPAARIIGGRDPFALRPDRRLAALFAVSLAAGMAVQLVHWGVGARLGLLTVGKAAGDGLSAALLAMALVTTFVPSMAEDILTRGMPLFAFRWQSLAAPILVVLSAVIYTANHLWRFDWGLAEQVRLFAMGLAFAAAALRSNSLWPAIGLHWGGNLASALAAPLVDISPVEVTGDRLFSALLYLIVALLLVPWRDVRIKAFAS